MLAHLRQAKAAFRGDSERARLIDAVTANHESGAPVLLDVGAGDGTFARALFSRLKHTETGHLVAIDPAFSADSVQSAQSVTYVRSGLESYTADRTFTCINMRQSAYYLDNPRASVGRVIEWLRLRGLLAATLWTKDCILYKLHATIMKAIGQITCIIDLDKICGPSVSTRHIELAFGEVIPGEIDVAMVANDDALAEAVFYLAARTLDVSGMSQGDRLALVKDFLRTLTSRPRRVNEIRVYRRVA